MNINKLRFDLQLPAPNGVWLCSDHSWAQIKYLLASVPVSWGCGEITWTLRTAWWWTWSLYQNPPQPCDHKNVSVKSFCACTKSLMKYNPIEDLCGLVHPLHQSRALPWRHRFAKALSEVWMETHACALSIRLGFYHLLVTWNFQLPEA